MVRVGVGGVAGLLMGLAVLLGGATLAQEGQKVTGVVVSAATNRPVANAQVRYAEVGLAPQTARTDSKGRFGFPLGKKRKGIVTVNARSFTEAKRGWPPHEGRELRFELLAPSVVSGTLVDAATRQGIEGRVTLVARHPLHHVSGTEQVRGAFRFGDLPAGPAVVYGRAVGYAPLLNGLTVDAGKQHTVNLGLLLEAVASGTVVDSRGEAVMGAVVSVGYGRSVAGADILASLIRGNATADADGTFKISGLVPDTPIALRAELDGRLSAVVTVNAIPPGMQRLGIVLRMQ